MKAVVLLAALAALPLAAQDAPVWRDTTLAPGVRAIIGPPDGTVLVIETADGLVLVDAGPAARVEALAARLAAPVRLVINTHYHEDHTGGNARFRAAGAAVLAHANLPVEAMRDTTIAALEWDRDPLPAAAMPTLLVRGDTTLVVGGVSIVVLHVPAAHTSGDLAVWLPGANVVHTGDVVEQDAWPFIDWWGGGSLLGTQRAVARLLAVTNAETAWVPGHGHVSTRSEVEAYLAMLEQVGAGVREALAGGRTIEETMNAGLTAPWDAERGSRAGRRFVGILYLGLAR